MQPQCTAPIRTAPSRPLAVAFYALSQLERDLQRREANLAELLRHEAGERDVCAVLHRVGQLLDTASQLDAVTEQRAEIGAALRRRHGLVNR